MTVKHAEYVYSLRSIYGVMAIVGTLFFGFTGVKLFLDSQKEVYILFSMLGFAGFLLTVYGIVSNSQWGCYVDEEGITWWSKVLKKQVDSISHSQISEIHFNCRGESNSIKIICTDGNSILISDHYIGDGKGIVKALVSLNLGSKFVKF